MGVDQAAESGSRLSSNGTDEIERKSESGELIGLDENAQSGGCLLNAEEEEEEEAEAEAENGKREAAAVDEGEDSLEMVSDDDMEANDSCRAPRESPVGMDPSKDTELDFEEDLDAGDGRTKEEDDEEGECGERAAAAGARSDGDEAEEGEELEEGEVSSEEDVGKHARMEPRPVCRFYSKGNCTWGNNCRFVHPGVLDKGNYNMFAPARASGHNNGPPGGYERPFDRPPVAVPIPSAEWPNAGPVPRVGINPRPPMRHPQVIEAPRADVGVGGAESAWERGLRQAKEMLKKSNHRKETDVDFEEKKLNLGIGEEELDKENDYYTRPASPALHGDAPPPFEEPEVDGYIKYPAAAADGRWAASRGYPPQRHAAPPPHGYPYAYEARRSFVEAEFREREAYHESSYERHYYAHKAADREGHSSSKKSQQPPLPPPLPEKRWPDERDRYVEVGPPGGQRGRGDEWWDPWMRSRSPGGGASASASNPSASAKEARRRSYSSGSSFSTSSSTSSSSSSSYSSSSPSSSRSSGSSRSSFRSKAINAKRRPVRKHKLSASANSERPERADRVTKGTKMSSTTRHRVPQPPPPASSAAFPPSSPPPPPPPPPPHHATVRMKTVNRTVAERSPARNRSPSSSSKYQHQHQHQHPHRSVPNRNNNWSSSQQQQQQQQQQQANKSGRGRSRSSSESSSSSEWESSPHSNGNGRSRRSHRGRRDFAERKELPRLGAVTPPLHAPPHTLRTKTSEPPKVAEIKQQIKLTLKSAVPQLKKVANKLNDDSEDDGICSYIYSYRSN